MKETLGATIRIEEVPLVVLWWEHFMRQYGHLLLTPPQQVELELPKAA